MERDKQQAEEIVKAWQDDIDCATALVDRIAAALAEARVTALEEAVIALEEFDEWVSCKCSECRADANSHAVDIPQSLSALVATVRDLAPDASRREAVDATKNPKTAN